MRGFKNTGVQKVSLLMGLGGIPSLKKIFDFPDLNMCILRCVERKNV